MFKQFNWVVKCFDTKKTANLQKNCHCSIYAGPQGGLDSELQGPPRTTTDAHTKRCHPNKTQRIYSSSIKRCYTDKNMGIDLLKKKQGNFLHNFITQIKSCLCMYNINFASLLTFASKVNINFARIVNWHLQVMAIYFCKWSQLNTIELTLFAKVVLCEQRLLLFDLRNKMMQKVALLFLRRSSHQCSHSTQLWKVTFVIRSDWTTYWMIYCVSLVLVSNI